VVIASVQVNSVTLTWTAQSSATRYKIFYTSDSINFYPAPLPTGYSTPRHRVAHRPDRGSDRGVSASASASASWAAYINSTTFTVLGLAEYTSYLFEVYAGDGSSYDVNFFTPLPSAQTLIARTGLRAPGFPPGVERS